jgi:hypothetical protein
LKSIIYYEIFEEFISMAPGPNCSEGRLVAYLLQGTLTERERLSTVNLLVPTSLYQLIFILKILLAFL